MVGEGVEWGPNHQHHHLQQQQQKGGVEGVAWELAQGE